MSKPNDHITEASTPTVNHTETRFEDVATADAAATSGTADASAATTAAATTTPAADAAAPSAAATPAATTTPSGAATASAASTAGTAAASAATATPAAATSKYYAAGSRPADDFPPSDDFNLREAEIAANYAANMSRFGQSGLSMGTSPRQLNLAGKVLAVVLSVLIGLTSWNSLSIAEARSIIIQDDATSLAGAANDPATQTDQASTKTEEKDNSSGEEAGDNENSRGGGGFKARI